LELANALQSVRELIGTTLGPQVEVLIDVPNGDLWVQTDPLQFELAILNLALNARDAMPDGGLFTVRVARPIADQPHMVVVRVSDTGSGMSPEVMKKACEPFFTTKEHGKGTGLGLAQVYGLCRQCGGDLRISSELGQGHGFRAAATFCLCTVGIDDICGTSCDVSKSNPPRATVGGR
jgi:signal transduction histidine kinase